MLTILSQTSQPTIVIPGVDPSWLNVWGVKGVIAIVVLTIVVLTLFTLAITPQIVKAIKSLGLIKRTWRDEMEAQVQNNKLDISALNGDVEDLDKKTDRIAEGTNAAIKAHNATDGTPSVNKEIEAKVEQIVSNADTAVFPAITTTTPTPEAIERGAADPTE